MNDYLTARYASVRALQLRLLRRWQGSVVQRWYQVWLAELQDMLPPGIRARLAARQVAGLNWPLPEALPQLTELQTPRILVLDAREVLTQRLNLPQAATRDLHGMLGYEIDRYTPFARNEVYFAARVEQVVAGRAQVLLVSILRTRLDAILQTCADCGLRLAGVDALDHDGQSLGVDLLPETLRPARGRNSRLDRCLVWTCAALLLAAMLSFLHAREATVQAMRSEVAAQREQMQQLQALRHELTNTQGAAGYLTRLKAARPTISLLLAELSSCVGQDSWIEQLEVGSSQGSAGGDVSFSGQSKQASALIGQMKSCTSLESLQFQGVIQPDAQTGKERFSLRARLKENADHAPTIDPS